MIKSVLVLLILISQQAFADDFRASESKPQKIECSNKNEMVQFSGGRAAYTIYDKNSTAVKLLSCEKIKIKNSEFYTAIFTSEIIEGAISKKVLTYEVALVTKTGALQTVRSELVDQLELSGDLPNTNFDSSIKVAWGQSRKDERILLKVEIKSKNETSLIYILKLNSKNLWFENQF